MALCVFVCVCTCVCVCVHPQRLQPDHRRERAPSQQLAHSLTAVCSLLSRPVAMAAVVKAVSMAKGGSWHPSVTDLTPLLSPCLPPPGCWPAGEPAWGSEVNGSELPSDSEGWWGREWEREELQHTDGEERWENEKMRLNLITIKRWGYGWQFCILENGCCFARWLLKWRWNAEPVDCLFVYHFTMNIQVYANKYRTRRWDKVYGTRVELLSINSTPLFIDPPSHIPFSVCVFVCVLFEGQETRESASLIVSKCLEGVKVCVQELCVCYEVKGFDMVEGLTPDLPGPERSDSVRLTLKHNFL